MNVNDTDLDIYNLLEALPESITSIYIRVGAEEQDFVYAKGNTGVMAEALQNLMGQDQTFAGVLTEAVNRYWTE